MYHSSGIFPAGLFIVQKRRLVFRVRILSFLSGDPQPSHHRTSVSSAISLRRDRSALYLPSPAPGLDASPLPRYHPAPARNEIAVVQPVLVCSVAYALLSG